MLITIVIFSLVGCGCADLKELEISDDEALHIFNQSHGLYNKSSERSPLTERFWLYTRNRDVEFVQDVATSVNFDRNRFTWILIHGWQGRGNGETIQTMKDVILSALDVNVFIVNWQILSRDTYPIARIEMVDIANELCLFLRALRNYGYPMDHIDIVGHSLGAHMAGIAGKCLGRGQLRSILGLDPAKPLFKYLEVHGRLNINDAKYVEVIHSNAGVLGFLKPIGDTDIYLNGGTSQPGCEDSTICPHVFAANFFIKSFARDYIAYRCPWVAIVKRRPCPENGVQLRVAGNMRKEWYEPCSCPNLIYATVNYRMSGEYLLSTD